jgi:hypothetical protein
MEPVPAEAAKSLLIVDMPGPATDILTVDTPTGALPTDLATGHLSWKAIAEPVYVCTLFSLLPHEKIMVLIKSTAIRRNRGCPCTMAIQLISIIGLSGYIVRPFLTMIRSQ